MPVPSIDDLTMPLLEELSDGEKRSTRVLRERLALRFGLSGRELALRDAEGDRVFDDRVKRARASLRRRGLIDHPSRGYARITAAGLERLGAGYLAPGPHEASMTLGVPFIGAGPLESELRALVGPAARDADDWAALCMLSGWGPEGILSFAEVAERTGRAAADLHALVAFHAGGSVVEAPTLDAVLAFACAHLWLDLDDYPFHLAQLGFTWRSFSMAGVCEAARRFGREPQRLALVRQIATARGRGTSDDHRKLPRPFESWFEVEVALFLEDHGYDARPQEQTGRCRADLMVVTEGGAVGVECAGAGWRRGDRAAVGKPCEHERLGVDCRAISVLRSDWTRRPAPAQASLLDALAAGGPVRSAG